MTIVYDDKETIDFGARDITARNAKEFLEARGAVRDCESCGANDWNVSISPGGGNYPVIPTQGGSKEENRIAAIFFLTCANCALVRPYSLGTLWMWLQQEAK